MCVRRMVLGYQEWFVTISIPVVKTPLIALSKFSAKMRQWDLRFIFMDKPADGLKWKKKNPKGTSILTIPEISLLLIVSIKIGDFQRPVNGTKLEKINTVELFDDSFGILIIGLVHKIHYLIGRPFVLINEISKLSLTDVCLWAVDILNLHKTISSFNHLEGKGFQKHLSKKEYESHLAVFVFSISFSVL